MGMTYVGGNLLLLLEHETGIPARQTVQELALAYAHD